MGEPQVHEDLSRFDDTGGPNFFVSVVAAQVRCQLVSKGREDVIL